MAKSKDSGSLESLPTIIYKTSMQRSGNTVERYRSPVNPRTANAMTQFIFDHKSQTAVIPDGRNGELVESTQHSGTKSYMTTNRSGRTAALGALASAELGASPDESGFQNKYWRK